MRQDGDAYAVDAPHFNAAIVVVDGRLVDWAPILKKTIANLKNKTLKSFLDHADQQGWKVEMVGGRRDPLW